MTNIYKYERKKMSCGAGKPLLYLKFTIYNENNGCEFRNLFFVNRMCA